MTTGRVVFLSVVLSAPAFSPAQVPAGAPFQVNTYTSGVQYGRAVAMDAHGNFVIAWQSLGQDGNGYGIFAQRLDALGATRGVEFRVNTATQSHQALPSLAMDPRGGFLVAWTSPDGSGSGAFARRYDANGTPRGPEFRVNASTAYGQELPAAAFDPSGHFVVTWEALETSGRSIFAQLFDTAGVPRGSEFRVNADTTGSNGESAVGMDAEGNFVVVWQSGDDGSGRGIFGRRFDASGAAQGGEFRVNTYTTAYQSAPDLAVSPSGSFVVAWETYAPQDGSGHGVYAQRYGQTGLPFGVEFRLNTFTSAGQHGPALAADASGNFVAAWSGNGQDGGGYGVFAQRLDSGAPRGAEFQVNTDTLGDQRNPAVAADPHGNFVVVWNATDGSGNGLFAQRFGGLLPAALSVDTVAGGQANGNGVLEPGEVVDVRPAWRNVNGAAQTLTSALSPLGGPPGAVYTTLDGAGDYGTVAHGDTGTCTDCYTVSVSAPSVRPVAHWDASALEGLAPDAQGQRRAWVLHVGSSFSDVSLASPFYRFVEALLHHGVTGGCGAGLYCPASATTRAQMAVFALVAKEGAGFVAPACGAPAFGDVPTGSPFCPWIEELARRGVVGGCGNGNYCPGDAVTRAQMAVFALATLDPAFVPPACAPPNTFDDVPETSGFCPWIEELARRGIVAGCGGAGYCPGAPVTRAQMGVFITGTFGLSLYGP